MVIIYINFVVLGSLMFHAKFKVDQASSYEEVF